jgi:hypothetical protein
MSNTVRAKLTAGVAGDRSRVPVTRQARDSIEVYARQMTFEDGVEVVATMWENGQVNIVVKHMNSGRELLRWTTPEGEH